MTDGEHDSRYSWMRLTISLCLAIVGNIGMWAVIVVLPDMQAEFGIDRASASLPYVAAMTGFAVGNLTLGPSVDRWGIVPVLVFAASMQATGFLLAAVSGSVISMTLCHAMLGLGASAAFAPLISDVSQWFLERRGIAVAIAASGNYLSGTVWPPIIVWMAEASDWRGAYMALAFIILTVVIPGAQLLRRRIGEEATERATHAAAHKAAATGLSPRSLQTLLMIAGVGCCVAMSMPQVHIVALCIDRGFDAAAGAGMLSLMLAGGVISRLSFGLLADRIGGLKTLLLGASLQCAALCLFLIEGGLTSLYIISLAFGLSQGGIVPSYAIIVREYMSPREAGRRVGMVMTATIVGMALGGWLTGWLYDLTGSYELAVWNGIGWNLVTVGIALAILVRVGTPRPAPA